MLRRNSGVSRISRADNLDLLIRAARAGEQAGIAGIYEHFAGDLFRTAIRLTGSAADAEDAVHDVFVGLPEALANYEERGSFAGWLRRVTVRHTMMRARRNRRRREVALDAMPTLTASDSANAAVESTERQRAVDVAICALPAGLREVLVLRHLEGATALRTSLWCARISCPPMSEQKL